MEILLTIVALTSIISNIYLVKKISDCFGSIEVTVETIEPKQEEIVSEEPIMVDVMPLIPAPKPPTNINNDSQYAWLNRNIEPDVATPSPHNPLPKSGPMERPYGFPH